MIARRRQSTETTESFYTTTDDTDLTDFFNHTPRIERMTRIISDGKLFYLAETPWEQALRLFLSNKNFIHSARWIKYWWCLKYYESSFSIILNDNINNPSDGNYWIIFGDYCLNHKQPVWYICEYLWYLCDIIYQHSGWLICSICVTLWRRNLGIGGAC